MNGCQQLGLGGESGGWCAEILRGCRNHFEYAKCGGAKPQLTATPQRMIGVKSSETPELGVQSSQISSNWVRVGSAVRFMPTQ